MNFCHLIAAIIHSSSITLKLMTHPINENDHENYRVKNTYNHLLFVSLQNLNVDDMVLLHEYLYPDLC